MKKVLKRLFILIVFSFILINFNQRVEATSISFSNNNPTVGESVTVTVSVSNVNTVSLVAKVTGPGINTQIKLVNGDMSGNKSTFSNSATVTPTGTGTISVSIESDSNAVADGSYVDVAASASVTVSEATSSSSDDSGSTSDSGGSTTTSTPVLSNLGITPYDFSGFKSGTTSYSVTVPNDCTSVTIYANTNSSGATISGTGTVTLKEGTNKYTVTVSNSSGSKSYTISIVRKSEENEIVANTSEDDDDEQEETSTGIGLDSLTITGYELNEEFNINTYEYTVTLSEEITEELLEEIKGKIFWTANSEDVNVEYEIEVSEDGTSGTITLIIKDEEKEYSRYVITFSNNVESTEEESSKTAIAGTTSSNNSGNDGTTGMSSTTKKVIALIGCIIISACFGVYFAVNSYMKSRRLEMYESKGNNGENFETEDEQENIVESIIKNRQESDVENIPAMTASTLNSANELYDDEIDFAKSNPIDLAKDSTEKLADLDGYRKMRKGYSGGKH